MSDKINEFINSWLNCYYHDTYWKMRMDLYSTDLNKVQRLVRLFFLKKMEARNNSSLGLRPNGGAKFLGKPVFPHGIKSIFVAADAEIGKNVIIYQQVTIGVKNYRDDRAPKIGDNVIIGAGAKIIGNVCVGSNVTIGANAVVTKDVPDGCTVVGNPGRCLFGRNSNG